MQVHSIILLVINENFQIFAYKIFKLLVNPIYLHIKLIKSSFRAIRNQKHH